MIAYIIVYRSLFLKRWVDADALKNGTRARVIDAIDTGSSLLERAIQAFHERYKLKFIWRVFETNDPEILDILCKERELALRGRGSR